MKYSQIRKLYGTDANAAAKLRVTTPTLRNWKLKEDAGEEINYHTQLAIESLSKGKLKAVKVK